MIRTTIDYGIDLGTTTSAIAVLNGGDVQVIKNNHQSETTASAVWIDQRERLHVGEIAKRRSELDPWNTCVEFKLRMGLSDQAKTFPNGDRSMTPEELSAEVLKSLKGDVAQRGDEHLRAAVVTVPAAFELSACEATKQAARLAGLEHAPLLQEPTAAALAYAFQSPGDKAFWLVYDLGGGTFDAAVVNIRDGEFTVVNHRGDNFLGGKLIDWRIVEELFIPALINEHRGFAGLGRGEPRWLGAIAKLKQAAEQGKIQLSRADSVPVTLDLEDERGDRVDFLYDLRRADVERLTEPFVVRSVNLCRKALDERGLTPADIEKVLLVGGPTLSPYLRERLADPRQGLGIPLDHSRDPVTAVAMGAAIFAGTQRLDILEPLPVPAAGEYAVELEYQPMGADTEPLVGGRVSGADTAGFTVEFVNAAAEPAWRSGKIALADDGTFTATLWAGKERASTFTIELRDASGTPRPVTPGRLTYTVAAVEPQPTLTNAVGVGLEGNEVVWLLERGTPLPARRRYLLRTTIALSRSQNQGYIRIPILEGEHERADRNRRVGRLQIDPGQITRDVPTGSEVEFSVTVDESRLVVARAYIPLLDEEFEHAIELRTETTPAHDELAGKVRAERRRLNDVRTQVRDIGDARAGAMLDRIDAEGTVQDIDRLLDAARTDQEAARNCGARLLDLQIAIDEVEAMVRWPRLVGQAKEVLAAAREVVENKGDPNDRRSFATLESSLREAITAHDAALLEKRIEDLAQLAVYILDRTDELPIMRFEHLRNLEPEMRDRREAAQLIATGRKAIERGDIKTVRYVNRELEGMFPTPPPLDLTSTVARGS
ncbi:Hsp70 family protein [Spongiactinospora sp. 9N601]|uniref:Hsp70 family protein n=1 Tax=Spongiactinospora sp. 9N601 TaxID=3375149 RepID=UPI0037982CE9